MVKKRLSRAVYVAESPFSKRDENRLGVSNLIALGLDIEFWEVSPLYLPLSAKQWIDPPTEGIIRRFTSMDLLLESCRGLSSTDVVFILCGVYSHQIRSHAAMIQALGQSDATLVAISEGNVPQFASRFRNRSLLSFTRGVFRVARRTLQSPNGKRSLRGDRYRASAEFRALDWIWAGVSVSSIDGSLIGPRTTIKYIHNLDYDEVLELSTVTNHNSCAAVLLDHMAFMHPDSLTLGTALPFYHNKEAYWLAVSRALTDFENESGLTVEIAAHPRAEPGSLNHYYGRTVRHQETPEAIAQSQVVLVMNGSTAVGIAVAMNRPMIVLQSESFSVGNVQGTNVLARLLKLPIAHLESGKIKWLIPQIDGEAYASYMRHYVKLPGTPLLPFWEVVAQDIAKNYLTN